MKRLPHPLNPAQVGSTVAAIFAQYGVAATDTAYSALKKAGGTFDPEA